MRADEQISSGCRSTAPGRVRSLIERECRECTAGSAGAVRWPGRRICDGTARGTDLELRSCHRSPRRRRRRLPVPRVAIGGHHRRDRGLASGDTSIEPHGDGVHLGTAHVGRQRVSPARLARIHLRRQDHVGCHGGIPRVDDAAVRRVHVTDLPGRTGELAHDDGDRRRVRRVVRHGLAQLGVGQHARRTSVRSARRSASRPTRPWSDPTRTATGRPSSRVTAC